MNKKFELAFIASTLVTLVWSCSKTSIDAEVRKEMHFAQSMDAHLSMEDVAQSIMYDLNDKGSRFVYDQDEGYTSNERHLRDRFTPKGGMLSTFEQIFIKKDTSYLKVEISGVPGGTVTQSEFEQLFEPGSIGFDEESERRAYVSLRKSNGDIYSSQEGLQLGSEFVIEEMQMQTQRKRVKIVARFKCILYPENPESDGEPKLIDRGNFVGYFSAN